VIKSVYIYKEEKHPPHVEAVVGEAIPVTQASSDR
jgi:hypothetical protein